MPTKTKQTKNCTKINKKKFREKNVSARYVKPCVNFIAGTQNTICNVQRIFEKKSKQTTAKSRPPTKFVKKKLISRKKICKQKQKKKNPINSCNQVSTKYLYHCSPGLVAIEKKNIGLYFHEKKMKTPNNKLFFWNKLYVKVCQNAIHLMKYSPLTINVISYNQYLCVKLEFENYLLLKKKTSKIICKTAILYYYIKNVCVCRFCHTVSTLLYYCFPPNNLWKCQICKQKTKTFVNKQLKFM